MKRDIRKLFGGDDPAKHIRAGAKDLMAKAIANGDRRDREALVYKYQSRPTLEVTVTQLRDNPPLWRMETVGDLIREHGPLAVQDTDRRLLEAELRYQASKILQRFSYVKDAAEAAEWLARTKVEERGLIVLADSQTRIGEWR
jgi:hypothetical protein